MVFQNEGFDQTPETSYLIGTDTMSLTAIAVASLLVSPQSQDIRQYVQTGFEDAQFVVRTGTHSIPELAKINRDFANSYRFSSSQVWLKEPFKLRMVSELEGSQITFVVNGGRKMYRIPRSNLSRVEDVSRAPGKRQTAFDFGMLTPAMFTDFFQAKFVRMDRATGNAVFDLTYFPNLRDSSRHRVWIDPERKVVTRREWYGQNRNNNRLMATFFYEAHQRVNGVWFATRVSVNNADGKRAGTLTYENLRVNAGLNDSLFAVR